jgi:hypothetical protein
MSIVSTIRHFLRSERMDDCDQIGASSTEESRLQMNILGKLLGRGQDAPAQTFVSVDRPALASVNPDLFAGNLIQIDLCSPESLFSATELQEARADLAELEVVQQGSESDAGTIGL